MNKEVPNGVMRGGRAWPRQRKETTASPHFSPAWRASPGRGAPSVQLTYHTDYALRVLVYLGLKNGSLATISEISGHFGVSRNHLVKVVGSLSHLGHVETVRGKSGGVRLSRDPAEIRIGELVRCTESHFNIMSCFAEGEENCAIAQVCKLKGMLRRATQSFLDVLDEYTLAHILRNRDELVEIIFVGEHGMRDA